MCVPAGVESKGAGRNDCGAGAAGNVGDGRNNDNAARRLRRAALYMSADPQAYRSHVVV